ncbi:MAG: DNA polymerase I, partial [Alphaproteobacteria bacterium]|nr:DNA polymerase I [Alphaproteobacteria bacterium]
MKHLCLIDGSGYIYRAFYGLPPMTRSDGTPVNAVYGFSKMVMKLINDMQADYVAVVFDVDRKTFRSDIYPEYKAHRPPAPDDLVPQFGLIREAVKAFNIPSVEMAGFEADDLIATYAKQAVEKGIKVTIVSCDKDLMQLTDNENLTLFDPMKNIEIGLEQVLKKFGVSPDKVIDVQSLAGDSSDNIPGIPGIGVKTAAQLINEYGDLETLLSHAHEIKQPKRRERLIEHADKARISKELVTLKTDVPTTKEFESFVLTKPDRDTALAFVDEQNFNSLRPVVEKWISENGNTAVFEPQPEKHYELVQTADALKKWVQTARKNGFVAVDTETTSTDSFNAKLVGISLATEVGKACYIPLRHVSSSNAQGSLLFGDETAEDSSLKQIPVAEALKILKPMLEDSGVLKIGHNIKYDMQILALESTLSINMTPIDDTMMLSYVLDGRLHGHGMDELAELHFGYETIKFKDVCGSGSSAITFDKVLLEEALNYAAEDADITLRLHKLLKSRLIAEHLVTVYEKLDRPLIPILEKMECEGVSVDTIQLKKLSEEFSKYINETAVEIYELAGDEFNIGSPKQLGEILFGKLGLEGGKKSKKTGAYSTSVDVLEELSKQGEKLPELVLKWRHFSKLKSTYTDALARQIHHKTKRVHTSYGQTMTSTGRLSSTNPNLQNIPIRTENGRKIRQAFVAKKGYKLLAADYSQIELRLLAHAADITALKQAFENGIDIHAATASQVFGVPVEGMPPEIRRNAKAINFGIIYGMSAFGLAQQLDISNSEAKEYIDTYFKQYPGIRKYMEHTKEEARKNGFVKTPLGRKCYVPEINSKNPKYRNASERAAINAPLQGGAADIIKLAMIQ